jgi:hypothetical protein
VGRRAAIQRLFETVNALHRDMHSGYFNFDKLRTPADIERAREILATNGVIFIQNAVAPEMRDVVAGRIVEAWNGLMEGSHPELRTNSVEGIAGLLNDKCTTGIWGNRSSGMLNLQPPGKDLLPIAPVLGFDGVKEAFQANPFYSCVTMRLIAEHPRLAALMVGLRGGDPRRPVMLSHDTLKVEVGKHKFTPPHLDHYGGDDAGIDRLQQILSFSGSSRVELHYVPHTTNPSVKAQLAALVPGLYGSKGFRALPADIAAALRRYAACPASGTLTVWLSGVVHFEAYNTNFKAPHPRPVAGIRLYCGTHTPPSSLSAENLRKLAVAAHHAHATPSRYTHVSRKGAIFANTQNCGTTQWTWCGLTSEELSAVRQRLSTLEGAPEHVEALWNALPPIYRDFSGVPFSDPPLPID